MIRPILAGSASIAASLMLLAVLITATNMVTEIEEENLSESEVQIEIESDDNCIQSKKISLYSFLPTGTGCIVDLDSNVIQIRFKEPSSIPDFSLSPTIKSSFSGSFLTLRLADGARSWNFLINKMDNEQRSFAEGRLNYLVEEIFGTEMSLSQSITSMLSRPSTLYIGRNSSGTLIVALKGMMERSKTLENKLEDLHSKFISNVSKAGIKEIDLKGRFISRDVRVSYDNFVEEESNYKQWKIFLISSGSRTFVTAQRGAMFVMSNDENALREVLDQNVSITPPSVSSMTTSLRIADGAFDLNKIKSMLEDTPFVGIFEPFDSAQDKYSNIRSNRLLWSLEKGRDKGTISIKTD